MNLETFADVIGAELRIYRIPGRTPRWYATFESCEIKNGSILRSAFGNGDTPLEAIENYTSEIRGQRLVFRAMVPGERREYNAPDDLRAPK